MTREEREKVINELISAQSALNNPPESTEESDGDYLSDVDRYAKIAYQHIGNAMILLFDVEVKNA